MRYLNRILRNRDIQKVFNHVNGREQTLNCFSQGMSKKMLMSTPAKCNYFKNRQKFDVKYYKGNNFKMKNNHILKVPILVGAATIGSSSKQPEGSNTWLKILKDSVKNSLVLHAADDDIPDINELAKDISEAGLKKIEEAQKILQRKLNDAIREVEKTSNSIWKMFLVLMVDSLEEAICELGKIKDKVINDYQCQRKEQSKTSEPPK
ncbi:hypothetical protein GE061_010938 [Apolygus lucorum]|uniref:Uncharacterized protein n=1 Tax=Apolygus lucorum TaxID=248454 RepID=A0A6A4JUR1_APOLU|nr:hypothetical protein GE061_010938 [Apolygus lucorum]